MDAHTIDRKTILLIGLAVIGFGMLQAARIIDPGTGPYSRHDFALFGLFVDGCTFMIVALMSYFARMDNAKTLFAIGSCMACIHIALAFANNLPMPLMVIRQIAAGMGWSLNVLCWMSVFVSYRPRYSMAMIAGGYVLNAAIPAIGIHPTTPLGPTLLIIYGGAIGLLFICMRNETYIARRMHEDKPPATTLPEAFSRTRRAVAATFSISFVCGFVIESDALASNIEYAQTHQTFTFCLIMAICMLVILLAFRVRKVNMDYMAPIAALAIASVLGIRIVTGGIDAQAGSLLTAILISFYVLLWLMLIGEAYERTLPVFFLLGIALGVARLSVLLGRITANGFQNIIPLDYLSIALLGIWILAVTVSLIFISYLRYASKMYRHIYDNETADIQMVNECRKDSTDSLKPTFDETPSTKTNESHTDSTIEKTADTDLSLTSTSPFETALDHLACAYRLSERESQIIKDYSAGRSARYIAEWHMLSEHTVKTHLRRAYAKLDIHSRQELLDRIEETEAQLRRKQ